MQSRNKREGWYVGWFGNRQHNNQRHRRLPIYELSLRRILKPIRKEQSNELPGSQYGLLESHGPHQKD